MKTSNDLYQGLEELILRRTAKPARTKSGADQLTDESTPKLAPVSTSESPPVSTRPSDHERTPEPVGRGLKEPSAKHSGGHATEPVERDASRPGRQPAGGITTPAAAPGATEYQLVRRPVSFYLTVGQNRALDTLRQHLREEHRITTDRSALLRAVLEPPVLDLYLEDNHGELIERLVDQLRRRFTGG